MLKDLHKHNESITPNSAFLSELQSKLPEFFTADQYDEKGNIVTKGAFDIVKFQNALKERNIEELSNGYQIDFIGKDYAKKQSGEKPNTVIIPDIGHNILEDNKDSSNLFLTGDNLEVLRYLQNGYIESVDMIYIDPPYNTGSDEFAYPDKFEYSDEAIKDMFSLNDSELKRLKSIQGKATHSAWLSFMYPRLWLAKRLLKNEGSIFISIDDNEQSQLKMLCDEIFGEQNHIGNIIWKNVTDNNPSNIANEHEYIIVYAKNKNLLSNEWKSNISEVKDLLNKIGNDFIKKHPEQEELQENYSKWFRENKSELWPLENYKFIDRHGIYSGERGVHNPGKEGYRYDIIHPITKKPCKQPLMGYRFPEKTMLKMIDEGRIIFGKDEDKLVEIKVYAKDYKQKLSSVITLDGRSGANELKNLFPEMNKPFTNAKTVKLIEELISFSCSGPSVILDFFAGSGTTANAVLNLNHASKSSHRFITVQLPEKTKDGSDPKKHGFSTIDEISRERIKRAANKIRIENSDTQLDLGFKHYRFVSPTQQTLEDLDSFDIETGNFINSSGQLTAFSESGFNDMITPFSAAGLAVAGDATGEDTILTTWIVADGYKMDIKTQKIDLSGYNATYVDGTRLYLIDERWRAEQTRMLLNQIGTNKLPVQTVVIYGYSFELESIRELEIGLKQLEQKVNLVKRY